jgi:hypothetical protein
MQQSSDQRRKAAKSGYGYDTIRYDKGHTQIRGRRIVGARTHGGKMKRRAWACLWRCLAPGRWARAACD